MKQKEVGSRSDQSVTPRTFNRNHSSPLWIQALSRFDTPVRWLAIEQLAGTFIPYFSLLFLMLASIRLGASLFITLTLAVIAVPFYIRIFIFFHDCGHGSFFHNTKANTILAYVCGILTFTPYEQWRHDHAIHHLNVCNLDRRGPGEITIMTVDEYLEAPMLQRIGYRLYRNPFIMFGFGFFYKFIIANRFPHFNENFKRQFSVYITDFAIVVIVVTAWLTIGIKEYLLIQMPVAFIAGTLGIWIFYVQHNFPGTYFARQKDWNHLTASMRGASYYKLPPILQWATGNIGLHHLHHVRPRIPNYNLPRAYAAIKEVHVKPLTIRRSLDALFLSLWDENKNKLVSFQDIKKIRRKMPAQKDKEATTTFERPEGFPT